MMQQQIQQQHERIDTALLSELVEQGYLTCRTHPTHKDLRIWNYTARTQYERHWTPETEMCRGLITTCDGTIIGRPFRKFFNWGERPDQEIPDEPFGVTTKEDGSLLIVTRYSGDLLVATRGSFTSEQALVGKRILSEKYGDYVFPEGYTYLFEVLYPTNRIVIDYGPREDVVLLAIIQTDTGRELDRQEAVQRSLLLPFSWVREYDGITDVEQLAALEEDNSEGVVLHFRASGLRLKVKWQEYVRLHRLYTQCTARVIWEYLSQQKSLRDFLEQVGPEFEAWVRSISRDLSSRHRQLMQRTKDAHAAVIAEAWMENPKAFHMTLRVRDVEQVANALARLIKDRIQAEYPDIAHWVLMKYNRKDDGTISKDIWKFLYPPASRPFRLTDEEEKRSEGEL